MSVDQKFRIIKYNFQFHREFSNLCVQSGFNLHRHIPPGWGTHNNFLEELTACNYEEIQRYISMSVYNEYNRLCNSNFYGTKLELMMALGAGIHLAAALLHLEDSSKPPWLMLSDYIRSYLFEMPLAWRVKQVSIY